MICKNFHFFQIIWTYQYNTIWWRCPPNFCSSLSLAMSYTIDELSVVSKDSPARHCINCSSLYSPIAGALSTQAVKAAFHFWYYFIQLLSSVVYTNLHIPIDTKSDVFVSSYISSSLLDSWWSLHLETICVEEK